MNEAYIIDAVRTPRGIGKAGKGALAALHPQHLAATVLRAIAERNRIDTADIDDVIWSTSTQKGKQGFDLRRRPAGDGSRDGRPGISSCGAARAAGRERKGIRPDIDGVDVPGCEPCATRLMGSGHELPNAAAASAIWRRLSSSRA